MQFNVCFSITSLIFLHVIIRNFRHRKQFPLQSSRCFNILLYVGTMNVALDVLGSISLEYLDRLPLWIPFALNAAYFISQLSLPAALATYLVVQVNRGHRITLGNLVTVVSPMLVIELFFLITLPFGMVFSLSPETGYVRGPLNFLPYVDFILYTVASIVYCVRNRDRLTKKIKGSFASLIVCETIAVALQFVYPRILLTGTAVALSLVIMFLQLQNPASMTDSVTGIFNSSAFILLTGDMLATGRKMKVVVVDIHGLRRINTLYGIAEGDNVLRSIAEYLSAEGESWVFRIGPTRFAMITSDDRAFRDFLGLATERQSYCWPLEGGRSALVNFTICHIREAEVFSGTEELLNVVEMSLSEQIARGESICTVDRASVERFAHLSSVENAVREALQTGDFFDMYYQPIYDCKRNCCCSAEALLRLNHPRLGPVSPSVFIPIAQNSGLALKLDEMVFAKVLADISGGVFDRLGYEKVHINLSAAAFVTDEMVNLISDSTRKAHVDPGKISIEITETVASASAEEFCGYMRLLKAEGFSFSLDDFGTGYSNLARLLAMPFDQVKLDKSLLDESGEAYFEIINMIQHLNRDIVAEGVETEEQAKIVSAAGVNRIQGYYYAKPMPVSELGPYCARPAEKSEAKSRLIPYTGLGR